MCGIIAVVARRAGREAPSRAEVASLVDRAADAMAGGVEGVAVAASLLEEANDLLGGVPGVRALLADPGLVDHVARRSTEVSRMVADLEGDADEGRLALSPGEVEVANAALVRAKDAAWAIGRDRVRTAAEVGLLAGPDAGLAAVTAMTAVQVALSAIDRLEVRGRDSAGLHLLVDGHDLDLDAPEVAALLDGRRDERLFQSLAVRAPEGCLSFAYKAAAEIGELGDNTKALRAAITGDVLLRRALAAGTARLTVLGHTRWASVGIISEANAHPLDSTEDGIVGPYLTAALNGDVDNYVELRDAAGLRIATEVTTDAKVIPALVSRRAAAGSSTFEAFRDAVSSFDGSVAIAADAAAEPGTMLLALRGSGQALYVGLAEDAFIVASEPYGVVEQTATYLRLDGETPCGPAGQPGQIVVLDRDHAGGLDGIRRFAYDGTELPVSDAELTVATITTRDIDRGDHPHYLLKELAESPSSFRKTLRGRLVDKGGSYRVELGDESLPHDLRRRLASGDIRRILVIGQGTAAVAGQAVAAAIDLAAAPAGIPVLCTPATELSGFGLADDMGDTLVVAISQSGTTTDTNRTVDLVRSRGAVVLAIVNRRNSDLAERSDGVLYTSDGRDVEMSVASTKAFYAQIACGYLLGAALAEVLGTFDPRRWGPLLAGLHDLPDAMETVLGRRDEIGRAAAYAPARRYWAIVGNGRNRIAADEIRIKLSELCYKSIASDATEDKKHIDLSSEPLIVVCAAGLRGSNADDVAKEVGIFRAHKAAPIVIATEGAATFPSALAVIEVPVVHDELAFVLSAMVGHLFGYEAALAIDAQALPMREARATVEHVVSAGRLDSLATLATELAAPAERFRTGVRSGAYDGHLEASTATRLHTLLRYGLGELALELYETEFGVVGTPAVVIGELTSALTEGIDQLTRPIDAIKHQAKTVTVGISRAEDDLVGTTLVRAVLDAGTSRDRLSYRSLRTLAALAPAVREVVGYTRYVVEGDLPGGEATIAVVDKGGVAAGIASRADRRAHLQGTKNRALRQREVTASVGRDGRTVVHVPETKGNEVTGLTLLHVEFHGRLPAATAEGVLAGYQSRLDAIVDAVTEVHPAFRAEVLAEIDVVDLLTVPVHVLASHWG